MMLGQGINGLAKALTNQNNSNYQNSLDNLRSISMKMSAVDKESSFSAITGILSLSVVISLFIYAFTLSVFPSPLNEYIKTQSKRLNEKFQKDKEEFQKNKEEEGAANDAFEVIHGIIMLALGGGVFGSCYIYYKVKKRRAKQRQMQLMMEDEIRNLKAAIEGEVKSNGEINAKTKSDKLSGATLVELFNSFADVMCITHNLPREEEETALEYFYKISKAVNFPENDSIKASRYFEDELYGKKTTTEEDRKAFLQLLLKILEKNKIKQV